MIIKTNFTNQSMNATRAAGSILVVWHGYLPYHFFPLLMDFRGSSDS